MEPMEMSQAVAFFKDVKEQTPLMLPQVLYLEKDGKFLASVTAYIRPESQLTTALMLSTLAAFNADKAIYVCEVNAQHVDSAANLADDPSSTPAVLVIEGDRAGGHEWILSPYGLGDQGELTWKGGEALQSPKTASVLTLMEEAWGLGDCQSEARSLIALLHANEFQMIVHRSVLGGVDE